MELNYSGFLFIGNCAIELKSTHINCLSNFLDALKMELVLGLAANLVRGPFLNILKNEKTTKLFDSI